MPKSRSEEEEISLDVIFSSDDENGIILYDKFIRDCEIRDAEIRDCEISDDDDFTFGGVTYGRNHRFRFRGLEIVSMYFINNNNNSSSADENSPDDEKSPGDENNPDDEKSSDNENSADENSDWEVSSDGSTFREVCAKAEASRRKFMSMRIPEPPPMERGEDPGYFKGRIFIGDIFRLREVYNSANSGKLYTELPTSLISKRKRVIMKSGGTTNDEQKEEEEEQVRVDLPMMGPCAGFQMMVHFTVVVHHHCGDSSKESSYVDDVRTSHYGSWLKEEWSLLDDWQNFEIPNTSIPMPSSSIPIPITSLDKPIQLKVEGPLRTLVLNCVVISDSLALRVQIKWFFDDDKRLDDSIYICGELAVLSANGVKSVLFNTPPKMGIMASVGSPISLPKSVVHIPYASDFKVMADLFSPDTTNDTTVIGEVDFLDVEKKAAASEYFVDFNVEGFDVGYSSTEDYNDKRSKYTRFSFYRSTKTIQGNGAYIQVSVIAEAFK